MWLWLSVVAYGLLSLVFAPNGFAVGLLLFALIWAGVELKYNYKRQKEFEQNMQKSLAASARGEVIHIPVTTSLPRKWWYFWDTI